MFSRHGMEDSAYFSLYVYPSGDLAHPREERPGRQVPERRRTPVVLRVRQVLWVVVVLRVRVFRQTQERPRV